MTFSLLPDCLSSRLGGSLDEAEHTVVASESVGVEAAAQALRVEEIELPGALRWLRRRRRGVRAAVLALMTAMPGRLGTVAEVRALRSVLDTEPCPGGLAPDRGRSPARAPAPGRIPPRVRSEGGR